VKITHPDKVLFPDDGITKRELAAYYAFVARWMVPHVRGRPVTLERYNAGIGAPGFFQKDVSKGFPEWLERVEVPKKGGTVHHVIVTDARSLLWLANQNSITPHVWRCHPDPVPGHGQYQYEPEYCAGVRVAFAFYQLWRQRSDCFDARNWTGRKRGNAA
jgi:DNA primase